MRGLLWVLLLLPAVAQGQEGWISDEENPGALPVAAEPSAEGSAAAVDGGWIVDPELSALPAAEVAAEEAWTLQPRLEVEGWTGFDTAWDGRGEAWHRRGLFGEARMDGRRGATSSLRLSARWRLEETVREESFPEAIWDGSAAGTLAEQRAELDEAWWSFSVGEAGRLTVGQQTLRWGSSDVLQPGDVIAPKDYREGFLALGGRARMAVPAVRYQWSASDWETDLVWVPFFVPNRVDFFGSDGSALVGAPTDYLPPLLSGAGSWLLHPSTRTLLQPVLLQTELPEATFANGSLGGRVVGHGEGWDGGLGLFAGWDRMPLIEAAPAVRSLVAGAIAAQGRGEIFEASGAESGALTVALLGGEPLWSSRYARRLTAVADAAVVAGPAVVRFESAFSPERTLLLTDGNGVRRPVVFSTLGLSAEPMGGEVQISVEGFWQHAFMERGEEPLLTGADHAGVAGGVGFDPSVTGAGGLGGRLAGMWVATTGDLLLSPAVTYGAGALTWTLSATQTVASEEPALTVGDVVGSDDEVLLTVRAVY